MQVFEHHDAGNQRRNRSFNCRIPELAAQVIPFCLARFDRRGIRIKADTTATKFCCHTDQSAGTATDIQQKRLVDCKFSKEFSGKPAVSFGNLVMPFNSGSSSPGFGGRGA